MEEQNFKCIKDLIFYQIWIILMLVFVLNIISKKNNIIMKCIAMVNFIISTAHEFMVASEYYNTKTSKYVY